MKILELFAGVGCFGLGLEAAGFPASTWHCEWDPFARSVLARHWPGTPCFPDVREVGDVGADLVVGGPPCQSISVAGKQLGPDDPRFLWPATMDVVRANRPKWCLFENPGALLTHDGGRTFLVHVARPLAEMGYLVRWDHCPASAVGAPHRRDRVWITAVLDGAAPGPADSVAVRLFGAAAEMPEEWPRAGWYDGSRWGEERARWPVPRGVLEGVDTVQAWPTPQAHDLKGAPGRSAQDNGGFEASLPAAVATWPTPDANAINDGNDPVRWQEQREECKASQANGNGFGVPLAMAARLAVWPTPSAQDDDRGTDGAREGGASLTGAATWATPSARDPQASPATLERNARPLNEQAWDASGKGKGKLNPDFAEWLLGMPLGWTRPDGAPLPRSLPDWSGDLTYYGGRPAPAGMPLLVPHYKGRRERLRCVGNACLPRVVELVARTLVAR